MSVSTADIDPMVPAVDRGLTQDQVRERVAAGLTNNAPDPRSRSLADIVRANTFTWFNGLLGTLWILMVLVAPLKQALFGLVIIFNTGIGIIQEYRASRELAKLSVIGEVRPTVRRDGREESVSVRDIVRDDLIVLNAGDQVVVDGEVIESHGLELDESLLTGEADAVDKSAGAPAMSGSFVAAGSGLMVATKVGADSFAAGLTAAAKEYTMASSELRDSVNRFIRVVSYLIVPIGILLVVSQLRADQPLDLAIQGSIAGMITMIPEGLVLLTSIAMAVAVVRLARRQALVQEMPAVEALARTDVVCVDKTGTLTDPGMALREVVPAEGAEESFVRQVLGALAVADPRPNPTMDALRDSCPDPGWTLIDAVPFSSARKWSAATYEQGSFVIGAPEMVIPDVERRTWWPQAREFADDGARVLVAARVDGAPSPDAPLPPVTELAVVVIDQHLRADAAPTVEFFGEQDVAVKVISGDNAATVGAIARRAGVPGAADPFDARELPESVDAMGTELETHSVFGRVTPDQKRHMVDALQQRGHTVTMTGDGVNDVLALKRADLGIAMGSGAPATRAVAQIVLLDNKWSTLPQIVFEGRRVLGNIERVSDVFLTKSIYAMVISLATGVFGVAFPFQPIQLTLVSSLTIGIPGFFLALMPNTDRFRPGFFRRVLLFAVPAGIVCATGAFVTYMVVSPRTGEISAQTYATFTLVVIALGVLLQSARPLNLVRVAVVASMAVAFAAVLVIPPLSQFFSMRITLDQPLLVAAVVGAAGVAVVFAITPFIDRLRSQ
ncbi:MAG: HAD-IC family P-type ATPase [Candidatus Nanopelagicales bacterium]